MFVDWLRISTNVKGPIFNTTLYFYTWRSWRTVSHLRVIWQVRGWGPEQQPDFTLPMHNLIPLLIPGGIRKFSYTIPGKCEPQPIFRRDKGRQQQVPGTSLPWLLLVYEAIGHSSVFDNAKIKGSIDKNKFLNVKPGNHVTRGMTETTVNTEPGEPRSTG